MTVTHAGGPTTNGRPWPSEAGVTPAPRSTLCDDFEIELRFGAVSRRTVVAVRRDGEADRMGITRTVREAMDFAEDVIRDTCASEVEENNG